MVDAQGMSHDRPRNFDEYLSDSLMAQPIYMVRYFCGLGEHTKLHDIDRCNLSTHVMADGVRQLQKYRGIVTGTIIANQLKMKYVSFCSIVSLPYNMHVIQLCGDYITLHV